MLLTSGPLPVTVLSISLFLTGCGRQHADSRSVQSSADSTAATPAAAAPTRAQTREQKQTTDAACPNKPTFPEPLPDPENGPLLFRELSPLWETGQFTLGSCIAEVDVNERGVVDAVRFLRPHNADARLKAAIIRTQARRRYKPPIACGRPVPFLVTVSIGHCPVPAEGTSSADAPLVVNASSSANGSFGAVWLLQMGKDRSARVSHSELGASGVERTFLTTLGERQAIRRAIDETHFFDLPESLGDSGTPVDGPLNVLEIRVGRRSHRVSLNDPAGARGEQARRFRIVWNAIAALSPVKPPM